jgi:hypothetical protein
VVEQPIRNRQVAGSSPALGSSSFRSGPETWVTQREDLAEIDCFLP